MTAGLDADIAILGGGLAGLSLAARLAERPVGRVLLLEPRSDYRRDRTWGFWRLHGHPFEQAVAHRWTEWELRAPGARVVAGSAAMPYEMIPAERLYDAALTRLRRAAHVELRLGSGATGAVERDGHVEIGTDSGRVRAGLVFDSRPPPRRAGTMVQRFLGQEVRAERPVFDPGRMTLMDFDVPQGGTGVRFVYVLPLSPTRALVEDTWIVPDDAPQADHRAGIAAYLDARFGLPARQEVLYEEAGAIPMDPGLRAPDRVGRVIPIGTAGGAVRPASGYAYLGTQRGLDGIVADLAADRPPQAPQLRGGGTRWMDSVLLGALRRRPEAAPDLFLGLFRRCPPEALLRFLGDRGGPTDYLSVAAAMMKWPMVEAALAGAGVGWTASGRAAPVAERGW